MVATVVVVNIDTGDEVYQYTPEANPAIPATNDRVRVPANGNDYWIVKERYFDYDANQVIVQCNKENK